MLTSVFAGSVVAASFQTGFLWKQLDALDRVFAPRPFDHTLAVTIIVAAAAGYALWSLSNHSLLAAALTALPSSKRSTSFDPLIVLELWEKEFHNSQQRREDEETLQTLVSKLSEKLEGETRGCRPVVHGTGPIFAPVVEQARIPPGI